MDDRLAAELDGLLASRRAIRPGRLPVRSPSRPRRGRSRAGARQAGGGHALAGDAPGRADRDGGARTRSGSGRRDRGGVRRAVARRALAPLRAGPAWLDERIVEIPGCCPGSAEARSSRWATPSPSRRTSPLSSARAWSGLVGVDLVEREAPGVEAWSRTSASCRSSRERSTRCCSSRRSSTWAPTTPCTASRTTAPGRCGGSARGAPPRAPREGSPARQRAHGRAG